MSKEEKLIKIMGLLGYAIGIPEMQYFDVDSENLLDEKIKVLEEIKAGKKVQDIPGFYEVLEKLPEDQTLWD